MPLGPNFDDKKLLTCQKNARVSKMHASMSIRTLHARTLAWSPDIEIQIFQMILSFLCQNRLF